MSVRLWSIPTVVFAVLAVTGGPSRPPSATITAPQAAQAGTSTLDDQVELAVTVYNSDIALVRDVRSIDLARGTADLHFMDIAATVNPATVHFR